MAKAKSQWNFGELFPAAATRRVHTVTELTGTIRRLLEQQVGRIWVTGEVTNLRLQTSGHTYFTLKDTNAQLQCVLFRSEPVEHRAALRDGQKLVLHGEVTVYELRGQYQFRVTGIELQGLGALQLAFERLKQKLQAEGLFAIERKRALPRYPERIGLVTSPTGAAIRDVLHVIRRRYRGLQVILAPCRVQGPGAAEEIAIRLRLLNEWSAAQPPAARLDLILVARGGGSLEDLWAFNEEMVARAIFHSTLPVVSAIGHEIDFTISDFVADARAATPSAGAEIITENVYRSCEFIAEAWGVLRRLVRQRLNAELDRADQLARRAARMHPRRVLDDRSQLLDELQASLLRCARQGWRSEYIRWFHLRQRFVQAKPSIILGQQRCAFLALARRLHDRTRHRLEVLHGSFATLDARLRLLSPENVLARGYSITMDAASGNVIRNAAEVRPSQKLRIRLKAGEIRSRVED